VVFSHYLVAVRASLPKLANFFANHTEHIVRYVSVNLVILYLFVMAETANEKLAAACSF
jgi:hypothetical protein